MRLVRYQVTNFRSVKNSGWIDAGDVTALIGVNESGKTNLLLPLWKLKPARDGELQPTSDYPKRMFAEIRARPNYFSFISAEFEAGKLAEQISQVTTTPAGQVDIVRLTRFYDGSYTLSFPNYVAKSEVVASEVANALQRLSAAVETMAPAKHEEALKKAVLNTVESFKTSPDASWRTAELSAAAAALKDLLPKTLPKTTTIVPLLQQTVGHLE